MKACEGDSGPSWQHLCTRQLPRLKPWLTRRRTFRSAQDDKKGFWSLGIGVSHPFENTRKDGAPAVVNRPYNQVLSHTTMWHALRIFSCGVSQLAILLFADCDIANCDPEIKVFRG